MTSRGSDPVVTPRPTDEEAVAIVAAMSALWPEPTVLADTERLRSTNWRFSGRWWARPQIARRVRP